MSCVHFLSCILYISFTLKVFKSLYKSRSPLMHSSTAVEAQWFPRAVQTVVERSSAKMNVRWVVLSGASGVKLDHCNELDRITQLVALNIKNKSEFEVGGLVVASSCPQGSTSEVCAALFPQQLVLPFGTKPWPLTSHCGSSHQKWLLCVDSC